PREAPPPQAPRLKPWNASAHANAVARSRTAAPRTNQTRTPIAPSLSPMRKLAGRQGRFEAALRQMCRQGCGADAATLPGAVALFLDVAETAQSSVATVDAVILTPCE